MDQARECLKKLEVFEADENIMIMIAHDYTFIPVIDFFPKNANGWHEASWKKKSQWIFLDDFKDLVEAKAG